MRENGKKEADKNKLDSEEVTNTHAFIFVCTIYALVMTVGYYILSYIMHGKHKLLVTDRSMRVALSDNKERVKAQLIDFVLNVGLVVEIAFILLMIGATVFMIYISIGFYLEIVKKRAGGL